MNSQKMSINVRQQKGKINFEEVNIFCCCCMMGIIFSSFQTWHEYKHGNINYRLLKHISHETHSHMGNFT